MKRIATLTATIVILVAVLATAGWNEVPGELFTTIALTDWQGTREAVIIFSDWSFAFLRALLDDSDSETIQLMYDMTDTICHSKWGEDARVLYLGITPMDGKEGDAYFWPTGVVFGQGNHAWEVDYDDCMIGFSEDFSGRIYGFMDGFIVLPDQLDTEREFTIWYDDDKTTFGPLSKEVGTE